MFNPKSLSECPVCRVVLPLPLKGETCPSCQSNLAPYLALYEEANELYYGALEALSKREFERSAEFARRMFEVSSAFEDELKILTALSEAYQHRYELAYETALSISASHPERTKVLEEIEDGYQTELKGKQHFNLALSSARKGYWTDANFHVEKALKLVPYLAEPWRLAVKIATATEDYDLAGRRASCAMAFVPEDAFIRYASEVLCVGLNKQG